MAPKKQKTIPKSPAPQETTGKPTAKPNNKPGSPVDPAPTTDPNKGLTNQQYEVALLAHGKNEIPTPQVSLLSLFLKQFTGFMPIILEVCFVLCLILMTVEISEWTDAVIIAAMMLVNGILGFNEEKHAKEALEALTV